MRCRSFHTFPCSPSLKSFAPSRVGPLSLACTKHRNQAISTACRNFELPHQLSCTVGTSGHLLPKSLHVFRRPSQYIHPHVRLLYKASPSVLNFSTSSILLSDQSVLRTSPTMTRKQEDTSDSSLSPPPEDSMAPADTKASAGTKRKADVTVTTTKRTKTTSTVGAEKKPITKVDTKSKKGAAAKTTAKKPATTRKKTQDAPPPEERTSDTKLRVGAHVSVAGGKSHLLRAFRLIRAG